MARHAREVVLCPECKQEIGVQRDSPSPVSVGRPKRDHLIRVRPHNDKPRGGAKCLGSREVISEVAIYRRGEVPA